MVEALYIQAMFNSHIYWKKTRSVRSILKQIVDICNNNPSLSDANLTEALVHLADFHLYDAHRASSIKNYQFAYDLLTGNKSNAEHLERSIIKPKPIPFLKM